MTLLLIQIHKEWLTLADPHTTTRQICTQRFAEYLAISAVNDHPEQVAAPKAQAAIDPHEQEDAHYSLSRRKIVVYLVCFAAFNDVKTSR